MSEKKAWVPQSHQMGRRARRAARVRGELVPCVRCRYPHPKQDGEVCRLCVAKLRFIRRVT
jgi:uncharacterized paraquat-inducible protein A